MKTTYCKLQKKLLEALHILVALGCLAAWAAAAQNAAPHATNSTAEIIVLPTGIPDSIEHFNRDIWSFNEVFLASAVRPFSKVYRGVVIKPVRKGIGNMGKNLIYPGRLINNLLQGNWAGSYEETERCLCNTVLGVGGFFDVATKLSIPKNDTDFGQTFKKWGWHPGCYLMLPILGPSDDRDATGLVADYFANPLSYFFPFEYIGSGVIANNLSDSVERDVCFIKSEPDTYSILQYAWSFSHENRQVDMRLIGDQDQASLETLQTVLFSYHNPEFPARGRTRSVLIPTTGKKLEFTYWLQPGRAPVVYIVPGFGAHRFAGTEMGLAELLFKNGFSPVCISSTFNPEFMEHAATTDLPSFPPTDVRDLHVALSEIDRRLDEKYRHRLGSKVLMGYSMGAFQSLFMAAQAATNDAPLVKFDRYVAIDVPVNLRYGVTNLDEFYRGALAWPAAERTSRIENLLLKVVALSAQSPKPGSVLPFNAIESKFLIGLGLRLNLRDIIFSSQLRHNQGVLKQPLDKWKRRAAYDEIMQYSFLDYIEDFATPYDKTKGIDLTNPEVVTKATSLSSYTDQLHANPNIRIIANRNDFLLSPEDVAWIEATFAPSQVTLFKQGGHLGNLAQPEVQQAILRAVEGLGAVQKISQISSRSGK